MLSSPDILATDLDGTLIPLEGNKRNRSDLKVLTRELEAAHVTLVFVTGRHYELALRAIDENQLPEPHWLITDVGTSIRKCDAARQYVPVPEYAAELRNIISRFQREQVEQHLGRITNLQLQEPEKQSEFKVSYYVDRTRLTNAVEQIRSVIRDYELPWSLISSVDPFTNDGLIDLLPAGVSKAFALKWFARHVSIATERLVFAGDSGNDLAVFAGGYRGIVVGNAHPDVASEAMRTHIQKGWTDRLYLAKKKATSGVLAGCRWFGLLPALRDSSELLGATPIGDGRVQFRVWAPHADNVEISIEAGGFDPVRMNRDAIGYHTAVLEGIGANAKYRYILDGGESRPDPVSRFQPDGVHGPSQVIDPQSFAWNDGHWPGVSKRELVIYELHVGAFTSAGTFQAAIKRLPELVELGITAVELLPVAQSPGCWNWGYDGVNLFAPRNTYGCPDDFRMFVDACHDCGLAVLLDVVYNHFGPEGNYLADFGPYRSSRHHTPWGDALNFDAEQSEHVRRFVVENAIRWLDEYHLDGLRLDAVHFMFDDSDFTILDEIRLAVADFADTVARPIHLIAESNVYDPDLLTETDERPAWDGIWCDCLMHAVYSHAVPEVRLTAREYHGFPDIVQALKSGYIYEGRNHERRSRAGRTDQHNKSPADKTQMGSLIVALQTHDAVGNHPEGKRLHQLTSKEYQKAAAALVLLSPTIPMIFMGEESAAETHFPFFADFEDEGLRKAVDAGRQAEYPHHDWSRSILPSDPRAFHSATQLTGQGSDEMRDWYRELLTLRKQGINAGWLNEAAFEVEAASDQIQLSYRTGSDTALCVTVDLNPESPAVVINDGLKWNQPH